MQLRIDQSLSPVCPPNTLGITESMGGFEREVHKIEREEQAIPLGFYLINHGSKKSGYRENPLSQKDHRTEV